MNPLIQPSETDWIVSVTHSGGIVSKFRVAPSTISEECAVGRAIRAGKIDIRNVTDVRVVRASEHVRVTEGDYETQLRALLAKRGNQ